MKQSLFDHVSDFAGFVAGRNMTQLRVVRDRIVADPDLAYDPDGRHRQLREVVMLAPDVLFQLLRASNAGASQGAWTRMLTTVEDLLEIELERLGRLVAGVSEGEGCVMDNNTNGISASHPTIWERLGFRYSAAARDPAPDDPGVC